MQTEERGLHELPPLANAIVDRAIDNLNRKLIAGARNRRDSRPNAPTKLPSDARDALEAASARSAMEVANRGAAWREMLSKSITHGISSLSTLKFDGAFTVEAGQPQGLEAVPNTPGVYVVFNQGGQPVYVGDSQHMQKRWHAGHLNEHKQGQQNGTGYKLSRELQEGCTVKYIAMESVESAAALEAHLIAQHQPPGNSREELKTEQGLRSNIEAKKMKDASGSTASLALGAGAAALTHAGFSALEQLSAAVAKAVKDELVDALLGAACSLRHRLERFFRTIWQAVRRLVDLSLQALAGLFEFIVNAVSRTISQFYALVRNVFQLGQSAWQLYQGARTMGTEELVRKVSETVLLGGTLILWDALDPVLETQLATVVGPLAPYLSAAVCAIGFGLSSFALQSIVPVLVRGLLSAAAGAQDVYAAQREACEQLIRVAEREQQLVQDLREAADGHLRFEDDTRARIDALTPHRPVARLDLSALRAPSQVQP